MEGECRLTEVFSCNENHRTRYLIQNNASTKKEVEGKWYQGNCDQRGNSPRARLFIALRMNWPLTLPQTEAEAKCMQSALLHLPKPYSASTGSAPILSHYLPV